MTSSQQSIRVAPALRALIENLIDYAGLFPPASLSLDTTLQNFADYKNSEYSWMLHGIVISEANLDSVPAQLDKSLAVLSGSDQNRAATIESREIIAASRPVYCEVALTEIQRLSAVKQSGCFAKIRTGGTKAETIPDVDAVAFFIRECAKLQLPFKATAGLHHPIRGKYALTYDRNSERATMHGFINVLMAAAFAWHDKVAIDEVLSETDISAFVFGQTAAWRDYQISCDQIRNARANFIHTIGSCSFTEPVNELKSFGLIS